MKSKKKVLILVNHDIVIYNFRKELVERLIQDGHKVIISSPFGSRIKKLIDLGCEYKEIEIDRHSTNPIKDLKLLIDYFRLIKEVKPDVVLTYTIKPNIYGGIISRMLKIPYIANITGLGKAVEKKSILQNITLFLYKISFKNINKVYFQNKENLNFFLDNKIGSFNKVLIPGSGVNLNHFRYIEYPSSDNINFVFISRIMKEKGIEEYLEAAKYIVNKYPNVVFHVCGFCEENYQKQLEELDSSNVIKYHGMINDVREILELTHCTVHPSYYPEGISNILLESASVGRPIITTDKSGCKEVVDNHKNGYIVRQKDSLDLIEKIEMFLKLNYEQQVEMGLNSRRKVEKEFSREIVVEDYVQSIDEIEMKGI